MDAGGRGQLERLLDRHVKPNAVDHACCSDSDGSGRRVCQCMDGCGHYLDSVGAAGADYDESVVGFVGEQVRHVQVVFVDRRLYNVLKVVENFSLARQVQLRFGGANGPFPCSGGEIFVRLMQTNVVVDVVPHPTPGSAAIDDDDPRTGREVVGCRFEGTHALVAGTDDEEVAINNGGHWGAVGDGWV